GHHHEGRHHGDHAAQPDRNAEADEALHKHLPGHGPHHRTRYAGGIEQEQEYPGGADAEQGRHGVIGGFDFGDVRVASVEGTRRHHHHRHIDQPGDHQCDHHFMVGDAHQQAALVLV